MITKSFCEVFIKNYSTTVRIAIALDLMKRYGLSQFQVAKLTKLPQPLINYVIQGRRKIRGLEKILNNTEMYKVIREFSDELMQGKSIEMCEICMRIRPHIKIQIP
jgi:predicted transcriptional regulator